MTFVTEWRPATGVTPSRWRKGRQLGCRAEAGPHQLHTKVRPPPSCIGLQQDRNRLVILGAARTVSSACIRRSGQMPSGVFSNLEGSFLEGRACSAGCRANENCRQYEKAATEKEDHRAFEAGRWWPEGICVVGVLGSHRVK